jgi:hypothetical protein
MSETIRAYADVLIANVKSLVQKGGFRSFHVSVRIEFNDHSTDTEFIPVGGYLHLACYAPNNYMRVYAAFTERPAYDVSTLPWHLVCSHDSAWREDGIRRTLLGAERAIEERAVELFCHPKAKLSQHVAIDHMELSEGPSMFWEERADMKVETLDVETLMKARTLSFS